MWWCSCCCRTNTVGAPPATVDNALDEVNKLETVNNKACLRLGRLSNQRAATVPVAPYKLESSFAPLVERRLGCHCLQSSTTNLNVARAFFATEVSCSPQCATCNRTSISLFLCVDLAPTPVCCTPTVYQQAGSINPDSHYSREHSWQSNILSRLAASVCVVLLT